MTDTTPPPVPEPTPPTSGYTSQPPAANPYNTGAPATKAPILSILSLVAGIIGFVGSWIVVIPFVGPIINLLIPAAAIVLGILGKNKEPHAPKGFWLTGIILGAVSIAISIVAFILTVVLFASLDNSGFSTFDY